MKYLRLFLDKESYKNEILPLVSIAGGTILYDSPSLVVNLSRVNTNLLNPEKEYVINGNTDSLALKIKGKSVTLTNVESSGEVLKALSNTVFAINEALSVVIEDSNFNTTAYNMIEIGLLSSVHPSNVLIENCNVDTTSNNAINIFSFADDAVITIKNCHFKLVSNMLRISNTTEASNVTINIENCTIDKWETGMYSGMIILLEHPTGKTSFLNITINIKNVTGPNGIILPTDLSTICGTKNDNLIIYVYADNEVKAYNSSIYPNININ